MNIRQKIGSVAAVIMLLLTVGSSRADFELALQEAGVDGGSGIGNKQTVQSAADFASTSYTGNYGDFSVTFFGGGAQNSATQSDLLSGSFGVTNTSSSTKTLTLYVTETDYSLPTGSPLNISSQLGGSWSNGTTVTLANISGASADSGNNDFGTSSYNVVQSAVANQQSFDTGTVNGTFLRTADYSLTQMVTLQISAGGTVNFAGQIDVTATPSPAGIVLALTGLPLLGLGLLVRRRKVA